MKTKLFSLLCCISLALTNSSTPTWAQPHKTVKIAFTSTRDGNDEIYIMNVDGSKPENLTRHDARDGGAVWSPTGEQIAFHSNRHDLRDLYIMDADGGNVRKLLKDLVYREYPTWSPDGTMLAYYRSDGGDAKVYVANIDESAEELMAEAGPLGAFPDWSPDGSEIVFTYRFKGALGNTVLQSVNVNTREVTTLYEPNEPAALLYAAWSPMGDTIAFYWHKKGIFLLASNAKAVKKLTVGAHPAWSTRGKELVYTKDSQIFTFDFSNRRSKQLTAGAGTVNIDPEWFDPSVLPVHPNPKLLTTMWGKLKQK